MPAAISASLVGTSTPKAVQVVVTGLTNGQAYVIRGKFGTVKWAVRAGSGTSDGTQVIRSDLFAPINTPVSYEVEVVEVDGAVAATSSPITVPYTGPDSDGSKYVLTSLDGKSAAGFTWQDNGDPREVAVRASRFEIPGRARPVVMYDVAAGEDGALVVNTEDANTAAMLALVRAGAPLLLRTDGTVRDLAPVEIVHIISAGRILTGARNQRRWTLGFTVIDDPEPLTVVPTSTWADFDRAYTGSTWNTFNTEWAGSTWNVFDLEDWSIR